MKAAFKGELQFVTYTDSSRGGPRVTFRLADRDELQAFVGMEGERFAAMLVRIANDGTPAGPEGEKPKRMTPLLEWSVLRCGEALFQLWIRRQCDLLARFGDGGVCVNVAMADFKGTSADFAAHCIKVLCEVQSRKEFDADPAAAERLKRRVIEPYAAWLKTQKVAA